MKPQRPSYLPDCPDSYESEGFDRENMKLPSGMNRLISAVAKVNPNVCVVLFCGSPGGVPVGR